MVELNKEDAMEDNSIATFTEPDSEKEVSLQRDGAEAVMDLFINDKDEVKEIIDNMDEQEAKEHLFNVYFNYIIVLEEKVRAGCELKRALENFRKVDEPVPGDNDINQDLGELAGLMSYVSYLLTNGFFESNHPNPLTEASRSRSVTDAERIWLQKANSGDEYSNRQLARICGRSHNTVKNILSD